MNTAMLPTLDEINRPTRGALRIVPLAASNTEIVSFADIIRKRGE